MDNTFGYLVESDCYIYTCISFYLTKNTQGVETKTHIKMQTSHHINASFHGSSLIAAVILVFFILLVYLSSATVAAGTISEGYGAEDDYRPGTLVSLAKASPPTVTLASVANNAYLLGVVEEPTGSLLALDSTDSDVNVALEGDVLAYVSDLNGDIKSGDFIGASWIAGVGMKASDDSNQKLLGIALQDFETTSPNAKQVDRIDTPSGTVSAYVGSIAVRLFDRDVGADTAKQIGVLENFASRIAGKDVPLVKAILAVGLFTVTVIISGIFLANAIRGSFISLGRNPLAGGSIFASLMQVSGVSIGLMLIGSILAYVILIL